jgi:hypothetical protein
VGSNLHHIALLRRARSPASRACIPAIIADMELDFV